MDSVVTTASGSKSCCNLRRYATNASLQCATVVNVRHGDFGNTTFDIARNNISQVECDSIGLHQKINIFQRN